EVTARRLRADLLHADTALAIGAHQARSVGRAGRATRATTIDVGFGLIAQAVATTGGDASSGGTDSARAVRRHGAGGPATARSARSRLATKAVAVLVEIAMIAARAAAWGAGFAAVHVRLAPVSDAIRAARRRTRVGEANT